MKNKYTFRYFMAGVLFGLCFPLIATTIDLIHHGYPLTLNSFVRVQTENPLLWIIGTAPLFLGIFAGLAGIKQDSLNKQYLELEIETLARKQAINKLEELKNKLDMEVEKRTWALKTSSEVSRRLSTILNQDQLIHEVVEQIQVSFNYYHTQIYLFDEHKEYLVMMSGSGEIGHLLLEQGHKIPRQEGLVGRAGDTNLPIWDFNVLHVKNWVPNPLLPETKVEVALPIATGDNVLGVLDVQDNKIGSITETDIELLQSIANQIAIALQNSLTYQYTQEQVEREALMTSINQKIQSTTVVEDALQVAVRELGRALDTSTSITLTKRNSGNGHNQI
jgi:putative methionine-R-sulfoxide reductase with GAF domain